MSYGSHNFTIMQNIQWTWKHVHHVINLWYCIMILLNNSHKNVNCRQRAQVQWSVKLIFVILKPINFSKLESKVSKKSDVKSWLVLGAIEWKVVKPKPKYSWTSCRQPPQIPSLCGGLQEVVTHRGSTVITAANQQNNVYVIIKVIITRSPWASEN